MKRGIEIIRFLLLILIMALLFSFSKNRNEKRIVSDIKVEFLDAQSPFITHHTVNKLLIQNAPDSVAISKEALALREMEQRLLNNPMIRNAEVYVTVDGILGAKIEQREPVGRVLPVSGEAAYYIDSDGKRMPLSEVYSSRVPVVSGIEEDDFELITPVLLKVKQDDFMSKAVVGISKNRAGDLEFDLRATDLKIVFGTPRFIDKKFQNFKAFYKKATEDNTLNRYEKVNLKIESQVIATKKKDYGT